jgi:serine protease AprX
MPAITIHGRTWDPDGLGDLPSADDPAHSLYPTLAGDASNTKFIVIQVKGPLSEDEQKWLTQKKVTIHMAFDSSTLLCAYEQHDLTQLRKTDFINYADVYHSYWKFPPDTDLSTFAREPVEGQKIHIIIDLHTSPGRPAQQVYDTLVENHLIDATQTVVLSNHIEATVDVGKVRAIAAVDDVRAIDLTYDEQPHISVARDLLNCPYDMLSLSHQGSEAGLAILNGEGEVINIVDTGFDLGDREKIHPAFSKERCKTLYAMAARDNLPGSKAPDDINGHGTHVTGCAVADGQSATMGGAEANGKGRIRGPAYGAGFTVTQHSGDSGDILVRDLGDFIDRPYTDHGCRISNHSYGPMLGLMAVPQLYDARNKDVDRYLAAHPDLVVTWSAGNDGETKPASGKGQIFGRAASKNVVTVGSTLSARCIDKDHYNPAAEQADTYAMSSTSSRGPTREGRVKPDLCAPGRVILSACSRSHKDEGDFGPSTDADYKWDTGTSMAAPAVAGCAAVLRQALRVRQVSAPTGALIKALLVNGAIDIMRESDQPPQIPNNTQGFGRVNLQGSLHMVLVGTSPGSSSSAAELPHAGFIDVTDSHPMYKPVADGATQPFPPLSVPATSTESPAAGPTRSNLKVTLTWYDAPGDSLQDILGLAVIATATGERRHGNQGVKDMRATPGIFDEVNNVQLVVWEDAPPGQMRFEVSCRTTPPGRKVDYALAWTLE